jgi:hypothetical protein
MDAIYLHNKFSKPCSWSMYSRHNPSHPRWLKVRRIADYVVDNWQKADMYFPVSINHPFLFDINCLPFPSQNTHSYNTDLRSIWEVRSKKQVLHPNNHIKHHLTELGQNFTYSKIQLWVALDRALRLSDKRNLPCPNRNKWMACRDTIYEEIMEKGFNEEKKVLFVFVCMSVPAVMGFWWDVWSLWDIWVFCRAVMTSLRVLSISFFRALVMTFLISVTTNIRRLYNLSRALKSLTQQS